MRTRNIVLLLTFFLPCALAQNVNQLFNNGSSQLQYICEAAAQVTQTSVKVSDSTLTNIVVATNVGTVTAPTHNLWTGASIVVSGSATAALNGTYAITVTTANAYTIATSGVSDGTYSDAGLVVSTRAPLLNVAVWRVTVLHYAASVLDGVYLGGGSLSTTYRAKCSDRATY